MEPPTSPAEQHELLEKPPKMSRPRSSAVKIFAFVVAAVVFVGLIAFGALPRILQQRTLTTHAKEMMGEAPSVSYVLAQRGPAIEEFLLPGAFQAIQDAMIYARVSGYLHECYFDIGAHVQKGQILAEIDTPELDKQVQAANSNVEQAMANLDNAKEAVRKAQADVRTAEANTSKAKTDLNYYNVEVGRYKDLAKTGAVSQEEEDTRVQADEAGKSNLDGMMAAERSARATVSALTAAVHVAQAALNSAEAQRGNIAATRSFKKVTAPFDGTIIQRNVDPGALVTSGSNTTNTVMFEMAKTDILKIYVNIPEQYVPYIHLRDKTLVNVQEYPGKDFVGTVAFIAGGLDIASRTLLVEIHVPNPEHKLMPGMYSQVRFQSPAPVRLVLLPATALQTRPEGNFVFVIDDQKRVHLRKVEMGRDLGGQFEISKGVKVGDECVISPSSAVQDGLLVTPVRAPVAEKSGSA